MEFANRDPSRHVPSLSFFNGPPITVELPPGQAKKVTIPPPAPSGASVHCLVSQELQHGVLLILDNPFWAVSDGEGNVLIEGLPPKTPIVFRVYHPNIRLDRVKIEGRLRDWKRNRFKATLAKGLNDLGKIVVAESAFQQ